MRTGRKSEGWQGLCTSRIPAAPLLSILIALCGCSCSGGSHPKGLPTSSSDYRSLQQSVNDQRQNQISSELDYYFQRHDTLDEGYAAVLHYSTAGEKPLSRFVPQGPLTLTGILSPHQGKVLVRDPLGRPIVGQMQADTLVSGLRIDSTGIYAGSMNHRGEAWGEGIYRTADGTYFEGLWQHDQREGFGLSIGPGHLMVGTWLRDQFRGEHMLFHNRRIYGIDISRYQHEKGRRHFSVRWNNLQVSHFGRRISSECVLDRVDYPVSFVYIKSTEGVTIENRYYEADDAAVRQRGIPVGAYHFFSTRTPADEQAHHFLANTHFRRGDLPPMLDIEPSDKMIDEMGGPLVLFDAIRTWIGIVQNATRTRPLLYFNQRFAHTYLPLAPDLREGYRFWVARYAEYKPDLHHDIWQCSGDGRVQGFMPEVDINVFNGYDDLWYEFLRTETIQ